ncbi:MAG: hypothetical protein EZS28_031357 [Streblomastix strix]|uniref:Uncharacterized protein n=1 Tax=Streblomastix strix TaxID=222440 RepID=A0A5J4UTR5_9EUKA|nr:MAG: hypothetical protein EZS28_031357 [Streblomastix strix]
MNRFLAKAIQVQGLNAIESQLESKAIGCTADLITSIRTEQLTQNGLKNLVCDIAPVRVSIKNYVVTEVTANMAGYKATDACLARVRDFFTTRAFVVPAQSVEIWPFPTSAALTGIKTSQIFHYLLCYRLCIIIPKRYQMHNLPQESLLLKYVTDNLWKKLPRYAHEYY